MRVRVGDVFLDVVYVYRYDGSDWELRMSLRSLKFIDYDRVFIIGDGVPSWVTNVKRISLPDRDVNKQVNVQKKLMRFCELGVSDDFLLMNDDFFFLKPQEVKNYNLGFLKDRLESTKGSYHRSLVNALDVAGMDLLNFEVHYPLLINSKKFLEVMQLFPCGSVPFAYRSLYCHFGDVPSEFLSKDFKIYKFEDLKEYLIQDPFFLSTSPEIIVPEFKNWLECLFPEPCVFEVQ